MGSDIDLYVLVGCTAMQRQLSLQGRISSNEIRIIICVAEELLSSTHNNHNLTIQK